VELSCSLNQACYRYLELPSFAQKSFDYVCMFFCCFLLALHYVSSSSNVIMSIVVNSNWLFGCALTIFTINPHFEDP